jgi:prepilin-type N-terminal cleavage/methylation domain-containing protein
MPSVPRHDHLRRSGVTLVELLVVLVLLGILLALAPAGLPPADVPLSAEEAKARRAAFAALQEVRDIRSVDSMGRATLFRADGTVLEPPSVPEAPVRHPDAW